ncbi:coiled-coil domain-containing protein 38 [Mixophyes fleayi]|uniref:coiled-coil domain-containing protein 38 n=1 Tax=Mixophyes fleayi TaxID=3061075 RepID=UPI003F4DED6D
MPVHATRLPPISRTHTDEFKKHSDLYPNPFVCPDKDIFTLRIKHVQDQEEEKNFYRNLKVCDKTTFASRARSLSFSRRKIVLKRDPRPNEVKEKHQATEKYDPDRTSSTVRCYRFGRESLREYMEQQRDMFREQFSIAMKQEKIRTMKTTVSEEEKKISDAKQKLKNKTLTFEALLAESAKRSVEALKIADQQAKAVLEKNTEIRTASADIIAIKSDIRKCEAVLKEYKLYEDFLKTISPQEWLETQIQKKMNREAVKKREKARERKLSMLFPPITNKAERQLMRILSRTEAMRELTPQSHYKSSGSRISSTRSPSEASFDERETLTEDSDSDEEPELYFTDPQQLLKIFAELEEQNVLLMQNTQEFDETMQEIREKGHVIQERMDQKLKDLKEHKEKISEALSKEMEKVAELQQKSKMFSFGEFKSEDQDKMLYTLNKKMTEVYACCIEESPAPINTLQMLGSIENRLLELRDKLELAPREIVEAAEKAKQKERRLRMHEENLKRQLRNQELRLIHVLERATADPHKVAGRKLMKRSEPTLRSQKRKDDEKQAAKKQEEQHQFFT